MRLIRLIMVLAGLIVAAAIARLVPLFWLSRSRASFNMLDDSERLEATYLTLGPLVIFALLATALVWAVYRGRPVDRFLVVAGGYLAPVIGPLFLAAAVAMPLALVNQEMSSELVYLAWIWTWFSGMFALAAMLPAAPALVYAERKAIRSLRIYAAGGAVLAPLSGLVYGLLFAGLDFQKPAPSIALAWAALAAAGAVYGLIYWLIAGRRAGAPSNVPTSR
ncbi:MAG: hypothetical protein AB7U38_03165 [Hyphomicrobiales bacterium]